MRKKVTIIFIMIILIIMGMILYYANDTKLFDSRKKVEVESNQNKFQVDQSAFNRIKEEQTLVLKNKNDVLGIESKKYYVYFSKKDCPFCDMLEPIIEYYTVKFNKPKLYFVDGDKCKSLNIFTENEDENINSTSISDYTLIGVPSMLVIENDNLVSIKTGIEPINYELKKEALN